jgi:hypothetical protein
MPEWERQSAQAVAALVVRFVEESGNGTAKLTREQRGQFVATAWLAQMYKHFSAQGQGRLAPGTDRSD